ncbi:MAG: acyl--CoA ligase, partial [Methanospirillum sp.]|nr:acyl--CoA ligase [Methanospirillum sp.]
MFNIVSFLDTCMSRMPDKQALIHPTSGRSYTYTDLHRLSGSLASGLVDQGIRPGDRVVIYLDSSPEYLVSYLAVWRMGGVVVPANIVYREEELQYVLR